jgi:hypothetical protein
MRGPFGLVVGAGLALLIIGIIFSLAPTVGSSIEDATPTLDAGSSWSSTWNPDLQGGGDFFADNTTWVTLLFLGLVAGVVIMMFMRW